MQGCVARLLSILVWCVYCGGRRMKVAETASLLNSYASSAYMEFVTDFSDADIVLVRMADLRSSAMSRLLREVGDASVIMVIDAVENVYLLPEAAKEMSVRGFVRSIIPLGSDVAAFIKRGYSIDFLKKTVQVYRESFIYGPAPIDYNTAHLLYTIAKFVLARRKGAVVEVGTGRGFSTMWLAHAAREFSSYVISLDIKCDRVRRAQEVLNEVGLSENTEVLCADARSYTHAGTGVVLSFIDGKKDEYHQYLKSLERYLTPGSLVLAHNTLSDAHAIRPYIEAVYRPPYESVTVASDPKGLTISTYLRQPQTT